MGTFYRKHVFADVLWLGDRSSGVGLVKGSGAPATGVGTGLLGTGSVYVDEVDGAIFVNTGTKASPTWEALGSAEIPVITPGPAVEDAEEEEETEEAVSVETFNALVATVNGLLDSLRSAGVIAEEEETGEEE